MRLHSTKSDLRTAIKQDGSEESERERDRETETNTSSCEQQGNHRQNSGSSEGESCGGHTSHRACGSCSSSYQNSPFPFPTTTKHIVSHHTLPSAIKARREAQRERGYHFSTPAETLSCLSPRAKTSEELSFAVKYPSHFSQLGF